MTLRQKQSVSGMTFIEVLVTLAISMISTSAFLFLVMQNRTHKAQIDHSALMKEILTNNVIEARGLNFADLPAADTCVQRDYDVWGAFQSEAKVTSAGTMCGIPEPGLGVIQVVWTSVKATTTDGNFSDPALKIPTYTDSLRKVTLHVRAKNKSDKAGAEVIHRQITIFKR